MQVSTESGLCGRTDLKRRLYDTGTNTTGRNALSLGPETPIWIGIAGPDRPVKDVVDPINRDGEGFLCYKYDKGAEIYN
jgi:hypothetical protein